MGEDGELRKRDEGKLQGKWREDEEEISSEQMICGGKQMQGKKGNGETRQGKLGREQENRGVEGKLLEDGKRIAKWERLEGKL